MQTSTRRLFTTVRTEGALLPADLLGRIVEGDAALKGLTPEDYHLLPGERINEATNRAWNRAVGAWAAFQTARAHWSPTDPGTSDTRERWLLPLFQELGYGRLTAARAIEAHGKTYPVSHTWGHTPIHLVGANIDLDRRTAGVAGAARTSPHGLVQELLTNADGYLWGFVSNGLRLRILRDSVRISRPAYVDFDLEAMMEGEVYADFVLLWLLCHESRVEAERPEDCWLEGWVQVAREQGTRVREDLRSGVQQAIEALGRGFLVQPANGALRERLRSGALDAQTYYHELLRLVYRLLFLFVAEDRAALLDLNATPEAKQRYADFYSTRRLRHLAGRQRGSRHGDLYAMLRLVLTALGDDRGLPGLALPSLGSMLFASGTESATPSLDACALANQDLLEAVRALAFVVDRSVRRPVDFRNLGTEELGSVYEALLELHPTLAVDSGQFALETVRGNERKTTGSYYTPESLAAELVKSSVEPVLEAAVARGGDGERAILSLKICDPAAGSGHFLLTAARMLAKRLAQVRTGDAEPAPAALRTALRDVLSHCIYAVDVNLMAVELCKVSLWMEAVEPGKPLNFLDHHIKCGNSLIGATRELLGQGVPDEAFDPVTGDDKAVAREIKRRNKKEREGQLKLPFPASAPRLGNLAEDYRRLTAMPEDTPEQIHAKQCEYEQLHAQMGYDNGRLYADAWCAAFFWPLDDGHQSDAPTEGELRKLEQSPWSASIFLKQEVRRLAGEQRFFHWHLEFPDVFDGSAGEGFDCVLGNPPWERIKLQEEEFFAERAPTIANEPNASIRKKLIGALAESNPELRTAYMTALAEADRQGKYLRQSGRFPLGASGDTNTYPLFVEMARDAISPRGSAGLIVKTGILADYSMRAFFASLVDSRQLVSAFDFSNGRKLFPAVVENERFTLLTLTGTNMPAKEALISILNERVEDLGQPGRIWPLSQLSVSLINPNTGTCPLFQSARDAELARAIYERVPILIRENKEGGANNPWGCMYYTMFHMTNDAGLFKDLETLQGLIAAPPSPDWSDAQSHYLALLEGKLFDIFDHRYGTFKGVSRATRFGTKAEPNHGDAVEKQDAHYLNLPRYWVPAVEVESRFMQRLNFVPSGCLAFRDVCRTHTDSRTVRAAIVPVWGAGNKAPLLLFPNCQPAEYAKKSLLLCSNMAACVFDYVARQKFSGGSLNRYILVQLPFLDPSTYLRELDKGHTIGDWITSRALELTYTSWALASFAGELRCHREPFKWDEDRRAHLRGELDGMYAHLYGLQREDFEYILSTFEVLRRIENSKYGEYLTARLALAAYDALAPLM